MGATSCHQFVGGLSYRAEDCGVETHLQTPEVPEQSKQQMRPKGFIF